MSKREVTTYSCDGCEKVFPPDELTGMTASVTITAAGSWAKRKFEESGDYCPTCLPLKQKQITEAFRSVIGGTPLEPTDD